MDSLVQSVQVWRSGVALSEGVHGGGEAGRGRGGQDRDGEGLRVSGARVPPVGTSWEPQVRTRFGLRPNLIWTSCGPGSEPPAPRL